MSGEEQPVDLYTPRVRTTLTPTIKLGGSATGITYTTQLGEKVVDQNGICHFWMKIVLLSKGAQTGALTVLGLLDDVETGTVAEIHVAGSLKVAYTEALIATAAAGGKIIALGDRLFAGTSIVAIDNADLSDDSMIEITGRYFVAV